MFFSRRDITNWPLHEVARAGIGGTFQGPRVLAELSLLDNMLVPTLGWRRSRRQAEQRAIEWLAFAGLDRLARKLTAASSGGQKKLCEFMRTLMAEPQSILLDEPLRGVSAALVEQLCELVLHIRRGKGTTFLLISHEMPSLMRLCETVTVLSAGHTIARGWPADVHRDPAVVEAYLGH